MLKTIFNIITTLLRYVSNQLLNYLVVKNEEFQLSLETKLSYTV